VYIILAGKYKSSHLTEEKVGGHKVDCEHVAWQWLMIVTVQDFRRHITRIHL
jgi:hypothetical protein